MNPIEVAWAAGFWEGEGSVYIKQHRNKPGGKLYRYLRVSASQVAREPLDRLKDLFGGTVCRCRKTNQTIEKWEISGAGAIRALDAMWPHLSQRRREQITRKREELT